MPVTVEEIPSSAGVNNETKMVEKPNDPPPTKCHEDHDLVKHRVDLVESFLYQTFESNLVQFYKAANFDEWRCCKQLISSTNWPLLAQISGLFAKIQDTLVTTNSTSVAARLPVITHTKSTRSNSVESCCSSITNTNPTPEISQSGNNQNGGESILRLEVDIAEDETSSTPAENSEISPNIVATNTENNEKDKPLERNDEIKPNSESVAQKESSISPPPTENGNCSNDSVVTPVIGQDSGDKTVRENGLPPQSETPVEQEKSNLNDDTALLITAPATTSPQRSSVDHQHDKQKNSEEPPALQNDDNIKKDMATSLQKKNECAQKRETMPVRRSGHIQITRQMTKKLHGIPSSSLGTSSLRAVNSVASYTVEPPPVPKKRTRNNQASSSLFSRPDGSISGAMSPEYRYDPKTKKPIRGSIAASSAAPPEVDRPTRMRTRQSRPLWDKNTKQKKRDSDSEPETPVETSVVVPAAPEEETGMDTDLNSTFNSAIIPECVLSDSDASSSPKSCSPTSLKPKAIVETVNLESDSEDSDSVTEIPVSVSTADSILPDATIATLKAEENLTDQDIMEAITIASNSTSSTDLSSLSEENESNAGSIADEGSCSSSPASPFSEDGETENDDISQRPELPQEIGGYTLGLIEEDIPEVMEEDIPEVIEQDIPEVIEVVVPEVIEEDIPEGIEKNILEVIEEDIPKVIEKDIPEVIEKDIPEVMEKDILEVIEKDIPEVIEKDIPEVIELDLPQENKEDLPKETLSSEAVTGESINTHTKDTSTKSVPPKRLSGGPEDDTAPGEGPPVLLPITPTAISAATSYFNDDTFVQCPSLTKYDDPKPSINQKTLNLKRDTFGIDRSDDTQSEEDEPPMQIVLLADSASAAVTALTSPLSSPGSRTEEGIITEGPSDSPPPATSTAVVNDINDEDRPLKDRLVAQRQTQNRPHRCHECQGTFWTEEQKRQHMLTQHVGPADDDRDAADKVNSDGEDDEGGQLKSILKSALTGGKRESPVEERRPPSKRKRLAPAKLRNAGLYTQRRSQQKAETDSEEEEEQETRVSSPTPGTSAAAMQPFSRSTSAIQKRGKKRRQKPQINTSKRLVICPYCKEVVSRKHRWDHLNLKCGDISAKQLENEKMKKGKVDWEEYPPSKQRKGPVRRSSSKARSDEGRAHYHTDTEVRSRVTRRSGGGAKTDHWNSSDEEPLANKRNFLGLKLSNGRDDNPLHFRSWPKKMVLKVGANGTRVSRDVIYPESNFSEEDSGGETQPDTKRRKMENGRATPKRTTAYTTDAFSSDDDDEIREVLVIERQSQRELNDSVATDVLPEGEYQDPDATCVIQSASQRSTSVTTIGSTPRKSDPKGKALCTLCGRTVSPGHLFNHQRSNRCRPLTDCVSCKYCGKSLRPGSLKVHLKNHCTEAKNARARGELVGYNSQTEDEDAFSQSQTEDDGGSQTEGEGETPRVRRRNQHNPQSKCPVCWLPMKKKSIKRHLELNRCRNLDIVTPSTSYEDTANGNGAGSSRSALNKSSSRSGRKVNQPLPQQEEMPSTSRGLNFSQSVEIPSTSRNSNNSFTQSVEIPSTSRGRSSLPPQTTERPSSRYGRNRGQVVNYCENIHDYVDDDFFVQDNDPNAEDDDNLGLAVAAAIAGYPNGSPQEAPSVEEPYDPDDHTCPYYDCHYQPLTWKDKRLHDIYHSEDGRFACTSCSAVFVDARNLGTHRKTHLPNYPHDSTRTSIVNNLKLQPKIAICRNEKLEELCRRRQDDTDTEKEDD